MNTDTEVLKYDDGGWSFAGIVRDCYYVQCEGQGLNVGVIQIHGVKDGKDCWHEQHHPLITDNIERAEMIPEIIEAVQQEITL